ncbi:MAG: hypothetical protein JST22_21785 [Bacteroidetes bacterium]|nr:hypothetical protein [Bacteroidota bacterium]
MTIHRFNGRVLPRCSATLLMLALLSSCKDPKSGSVGMSSVDSVRAERAAMDSAAARAHTIDSTMTAAPPPLAMASPEFASDTIPLHAPNGEPARYGLKSGRIVQRYTGNSRGVRTITFDDYGMRERRDDNVVPYPEGRKGQLHNLITIITPERQVVGDVRSGKGWERPNESLQKYIQMAEAQKISLGEATLAASGGDRLPDTTIGGYHCRVLRKNVRGMLITNWVWRGVVIREHVVIPADSLDYSVVPVEIVPNAAVPDTSFRLPDTYAITPYKPGQETKKK